MTYPYCWIAVALYGADDWRTLAARLMLSERARKSLKWRVVTRAYRLLGRPAAWLVRHGVDWRRRRTDFLSGNEKRLVGNGADSFESGRDIGPTDRTAAQRGLPAGYPARRL